MLLAAFVFVVVAARLHLPRSLTAPIVLLGAAVWLYLPWWRDVRRRDPSLSPTLFARFVLGETLAVFNPFILLQGTLQMAGTLWHALPPHRPDRDSEVIYRLPFTGAWHVFNGGITPEQSHSWDIISQRYAYDFNQPFDAARRATASRPEDFPAYGQPILAPADGVVVAMRDCSRDFPDAGRGRKDWRATDLRGNFVLIRHAAHEFSLLAHLQRGSVIVHIGQTVAAGQPVGRCGNSGNSTEPHLHFHVQDSASFGFARGVRPRFGEFCELPADQRNLVACSGFLRRDTTVCQPVETL